MSQRSALRDSLVADRAAPLSVFAAPLARAHRPQPTPPAAEPDTPLSRRARFDRSITIACARPRQGRRRGRGAAAALTESLSDSAASPPSRPRWPQAPTEPRRAGGDLSPPQGKSPADGARLAGESWDALRSELDDLSDRVDWRARQRDADLETLTKFTRPGPGVGLARKLTPCGRPRARTEYARGIDAARRRWSSDVQGVGMQDSVSRSLETSTTLLPD